MRRWASHFAGTWLAFLIPSLIGWGLVVRWSEAGVDRFHRVWTWFADKLAFPLLLQPLTDRAWNWLDDGNMLQATFGFLLVIAVWCVMFALPISVIVAWARWFDRRTNPSPSYAPATLINDPLALPIIDARVRGGGAFSLLYAVTIPLALGYHALRGLVPTLGHVFLAFIITWLISILVFAGWLNGVVPSDWDQTLLEFRTMIWEGYLDDAHVPRILDEQWQGWWREVWTRTLDADREEVEDIPRQWFFHADLRNLVMVLAARHALVPTLAIGVLSILRRLLGGDTRSRGR